jgi:hypothetical protein
MRNLYLRGGLLEPTRGKGRFSGGCRWKTCLLSIPSSIFLQSIVSFAGTVLSMIVSLLAVLYYSRMLYSILHAADLKSIFPVFLIQLHGIFFFRKKDSGLTLLTENIIHQVTFRFMELGSALKGNLTSGFTVQCSFIYGACTYYNVS